MPRIKDIDKAIKCAGGIGEFNRKFAEYCNNEDYFQRHRKEFLGSYKDQWIVIYNTQLKFSGKSWNTVINKISKERLPQDEVFIQYISSKPKVMVL